MIVKVTVTHLKASWPEGTKVGDVVEIEGDAVPAWLVGKCVPADEPAAPAQAPAPAPAAKSKR